MDNSAELLKTLLDWKDGEHRAHIETRGDRRYLVIETEDRKNAVRIEIPGGEERRVGGHGR